MSTFSWKLNTPNFVPSAAAGSEPPEGPAGPAEPAEPPSTRFRASSTILGGAHDSANCEIDGSDFVRNVNLLLSSDPPKLEEVKLKIERCRDSRIQETLGYDACDLFMHGKIVDMYMNLRDVFEVPVPKGTKLSYVKGRVPPQYFLVLSPSPISEAPWYGSSVLKVTNTDYLPEGDLKDPIVKAAKDASLEHAREREGTRRQLRYFLFESAIQVMNDAGKKVGCGDEHLAYAARLVDEYFPPVPPPSANMAIDPSLLYGIMAQMGFLPTHAPFVVPYSDPSYYIPPYTPGIGAPNYSLPTHLPAENAPAEEPQGGGRRKKTRKQRSSRKGKPTRQRRRR